MTELLAQIRQRTSFGEPSIPASESLLRASSQVIQSAYTEWDRRIGFANREALGECFLPFPAVYVPPTMGEIMSYLAQFGSARNSAHFKDTHTYALLNTMSRDIALSDAPLSQRLSADIVINVGLYFDGAFSANSKNIAGVNFEIGVKECASWSEEFSPLLLASRLRLFDKHRANPISTAATIGEALHTVRRFPNAFMYPRRSESTKLLGEALVVGEQELRKASGEAWMSYIVLAFRAPGAGLRSTASIVEFARALAESGEPVEKLQPYVTHVGMDANMVLGAAANGIGVDVLDSLMPPAPRAT